AEQQAVPGGGLLIRPVDKRENYIKRCIAVPGDILRIEHGQVFVNGQAQPLASTGQYSHEFVLTQPFNPDRLQQMLDISASDLYQAQLQDGRVLAVIPCSPEVAEKLSKFESVVSMQRQDHPRGFYGDERYHHPIFPNTAGFDWTEDNF